LQGRSRGAWLEMGATFLVFVASHLCLKKHSAPVQKLRLLRLIY